MKTKNMKLRSSRMREINNDRASISSIQIKILSAPLCYYSNCEKGPDLKAMTLDQFPIDSATFTKLNDYQYKIYYNFNSNLNDSFTISGPFPPSIISEINNYELRKRNWSSMNTCICSSFFQLRNKRPGEINEGFMTGWLETLLNEANSGGVIGIPSQIILPASFIVFSQQGLYYYLNVDQNGNVTFSST